MKNISFCIVCLFLVGCTGNTSQNLDQTQINGNSSSSSGGANTVEVQEPLRTDLPGPAHEYTFLFNDTMEEKVSIVHAAGEQVKIFFINSSASSMEVDIDFQGDPGNFRLSQIIAPDGSSDGPFGIDTSYELTQFGGYQLIFSESNMLGEPWEGEAVISIELEK